MLEKIGTVDVPRGKMFPIDVHVIVKGQGQTAGLCSNAFHSISFDPDA